jgi:bifunctional DNA-binding transcriptional regulator/antitoxin component of YhaV-PrlF toxin-antitoxin module
MVVTIPQPVLDDVQIDEGDRVLLESFPPDRIFIIKEHKKMPSARRAELELEVLESRKNLLESEMSYMVTQKNTNVPCDPGMGDPDVVALRLQELQKSRDQVALEIAEKRLQIFELEGGANPEDPDRVRSATETLCHELEQYLAEFKQGGLTFAEIKRLYDSHYRSKARALAEAMLHYVPDNDPRLMMVSRIGNLRTFKSNDVTMIECLLSESVITTHLGTVLKKLRELTKYLPKSK